MVGIIKKTAIFAGGLFFVFCYYYFGFSVQSFDFKWDIPNLIGCLFFTCIILLTFLGLFAEEDTQEEEREETREEARARRKKEREEREARWEKRARDYKKFWEDAGFDINKSEFLREYIRKWEEERRQREEEEKEERRWRQQEKARNKAEQPKGFCPYSILGVSLNSSKKEIRKAYMNLCFKFHPDRNGGVGEDKLKKINQAYQAIFA